MKRQRRTKVWARIGLALSGAAAILAGLFVAVPLTATAAPVGLQISNGKVVESNGNEFIMRGVNHAHTWYTSQTQSFADIKQLGANTVRVVLSNGTRWTRNDAADVANVIGLCKENRLICVLEVHDTTGYGEEGAAATLDQAADYWISLKSVLDGEEDYVVINIGNEPFGNSGYEQWTSHTGAAITKLRDAGFNHMIMVDAPNWGQDWTGTMRDNAQTVFNADPDRNTLFSIHMYGVYEQASTIDSYLTTFRNAGLPIAIGEFGHDHSDGNPDEDAILRLAEQYGIGYLGWSWSGNSGGVEYLDMVTNFDADQLTSWGQRLFNGANGIAQTAEEATIYGGGGTNGGTTDGGTTDGGTTDGGTTDGGTTDGGTTDGGTTDGGTTDGGTTGGNGDISCAVTYRKVGEWPGGFQGEVVVSNTGSAAISGWTLEWDFPNGQTISNMWGGRPSQSGASVTVTPESWTSTIAAGSAVTIGFIGSWNGSNGSPAAFTLNDTACGS